MSVSALAESKAMLLTHWGAVGVIVTVTVEAVTVLVVVPRV